MTDPLSDVRLLRAVVQGECDTMGLELVSMAVVAAATEDEKDLIQVILRVKPEALLDPEELQARKDRAAFEDMMANSGVLDIKEVDERTAEAVKEIQKKGFTLDD